MKTVEIRQRFLDYFARTGHTVVPSASLISQDPTVLFTIAGMAPFKPYFLGQQTPPYTRATSVQKCVRTSDIDNVGITTRHNTFFQMAGNFSFGDYFKEGAITHAWALLTSSIEDGGFALDKDRLWVTVYETDDEAIELWHRIAGLPLERIQKMGMADNFWSMGVPGPCGPCSEIYYDRGPAFGKEGGPVADENRYLEVWNLVFMQDIRGEGGDKGAFPILGPLPQQNIDTGLGVERLAFLLQEVENVYETDLLRPLISTAEALSGKVYGAEGGKTDDVRFRVIADHIRSGTLLIADGVGPGNEGRGYVLRRLLRRTIRSARLLGVTEPVMPALVAQVRDLMTPLYPELTSDFARIERVAVAEEVAFLKTLETGSKLFGTAASDTRDSGSTVVPGDTAFALHDTYGFPIDLTLEMAEESGLTVDTAGFIRLMDEQKQRARADAKARKGGFADQSVYRELLEAGATEFTGYDELNSEAAVRGVISQGQRIPVARVGDIVEVVLDRTSLYAEAGGQDSDSGSILGAGMSAEVLDVQKISRKLWVHQVRITEGELAEGDAVLTQVDPAARARSNQAHTGTHLVNAALRELLGPDALQAGSYNKPGYLRLDFSWSGSLSAGAASEIEEVANRAIRSDLAVSTSLSTVAQAKARGAVALFGEVYGDEVRVVEIGGPWSLELCGGTHVQHSSQIGTLVLLGESSVGSGVRRIESYVGYEAFQHLATERALVENLSGMLKVPSKELPGRVSGLVERLRLAEKELAGLKSAAVLSSAQGLIDGAEQVGDTAVISELLPAGISAADLRTLATDIRSRLGSRVGVVALFAIVDDAVSFVVALTPAAVSAGKNAGALVTSFLPSIQGRGGGKAEMAQGGGTNPAGVTDARAALRSAISGAAG
ncbi:alanine--tRNA ligase [Nakamurella antarctica]|uniref:Alanine--tRNA ligase n=1 Tax=Nakamurella antarctica TaxID=1902245 RepID=A0A3G8ZKH1_9ACTN|nr:alanine--tRNA ligase [Nakamurella antarctica]AZI57753.1 alanine--tRNA ligase [Nakamurella antarctica]